MESWQETCERLAKALRGLRPERIELLNTDHRILTIMLVSSKFQNLRSITRYRLADGMIKLLDPGLYANFLFIYEAWTPAEFATFQCKKK